MKKREKVDYETWTYFSTYQKDKAERLMSGWTVVDTGLMEKSQWMLVNWIFYVKGWIIYEK